MEIICFIASLSSGGAERQLCMLSGFLASQGHRVSMVNYTDAPDHYKVPSGVSVIKLGQGRSKFSKILSVFRFFLKVKADAIVSFGQRDNFFALIPLMVRRKPIVIAGERNVTIGKPSIYERFLLAILYRRADYIIPNSYSQRNYLLKLKPNWHNKIRTIINYTDIEALKPDKAENINNDIIEIGIFSRFVPQKNCLNFLKAISIVHMALGQQLKFCWFGNLHPVGNANTQYMALIKETIKLNGLEEIFEMHDHVSDVPSQMKRFTAVCLPSLKEGFSNSISEALCLGKPVLASDVSDNSVLVKNGVNGFLFDPTQVEDIASAILKFASLTIEEKIEMGKQSRIIAENLFNKEDFINNYESLISNRRLL